MDETFALPDRKARSGRIALRTQQVIANETRVANVTPIRSAGRGTSARCTDELERRSEAIFARVDELGVGSMLDGAVRGVEEGWFPSRRSPTRLRVGAQAERGPARDRRRDPVVPRGERRSAAATLRIGPEVEEEQRRRLEKVRNDRDAHAVERVLARVRSDAAEPTTNLMPALLDAVRAYATLGEIVEALASVFGRWVETTAKI